MKNRFIRIDAMGNQDQIFQKVVTQLASIWR
jgi:hypothetical protein